MVNPIEQIAEKEYKAKSISERDVSKVPVVWERPEIPAPIPKIIIPPEKPEIPLQAPKEKPKPSYTLETSKRMLEEAQQKLKEAKIAGDTTLIKEAQEAIERRAGHLAIRKGLTPKEYEPTYQVYDFNTGKFIGVSE